MVRAISQRRCERSFNRPTLIESGVKGCLGYPNLSSPLSYGVSFTTKRNPAIRPAIICLLEHGCPSAITGFVVAIRIDPVKAHSVVRTRSHIFQKLCKVVPSLADLNAACAIESVAASLRITASRSHALPNPVLWRLAGQPMFSYAVAGVLIFITAARYDSSFGEMVTAHPFLRATVAAAPPPRTTQIPYDCKASISTTAKVHEVMGRSHRESIALFQVGRGRIHW